MSGKKPHNELPGSANSDVAAAEQKNETAERETLLKERRERQLGRRRSGMFRRYATAGATLILFAGVLIASVGPGGLLSIFGASDNSQKASKEGLEVDREKQNTVDLDFLVPSPVRERDRAPDPNKELKERLTDLQNQLAILERTTKRPMLSASDIREMLDENTKHMSEKLAQQQKALEAENAKLKAEAERLTEEQRRADEDAKSEAARQAARDKIDAMQKKSEGVIMDQSRTGASLGGTGEMIAGQTELSSNRQFLANAASSVVETSQSTPLADPSRMIVQGTIISAVLETAINTELPGNIRAQVMEPVYSFDGTRVLMPAGTILIGAFNEDIDIAQKRVLIAWNRAVTPKGRSIAIGSTGTDLLGRAGTTGNVDNRYGQKFGAALLVSTISALPTVLSNALSPRGSSSGVTINVGGGGGQQDAGGEIASDIGKEISDQSKGILERYLSLSPIIRIPQGEEIRVFVNRDLVFR
jgi:type IV secretion system protein VirB10